MVNKMWRVVVINANGCGICVDANAVIYSGLPVGMHHGEGTEKVPNFENGLSFCYKIHCAYSIAINMLPILG
jgi:hypothetical protein